MSIFWTVKSSYFWVNTILSDIPKRNFRTSQTLLNVCLAANPALATPMNPTKFNFRYLLFLALVSAMGGFLFGYDWVVIGGAKPFYELYFGISFSPTLQGWAVSCALVGCILGAIFSGALADRLGRKVPLILAAVLFAVSAFGTGYADHLTPFIIYRLIGGLGIGLASTLSPLYIAEMAPTKYRGQLVAINQLTVVVGILAAQIANYSIAEPIAATADAAQILTSWNGQTGWRWMFWAELIPAGLFFVFMFLIPESPRFLAKTNKDAAATGVLTKIGGEAYARHELHNIKQTLQEQHRRVSFSEFGSPKVAPILRIGIVLAIFQQWCGINIIFNYAEEIFTEAGYSVGDMLFNIVSSREALTLSLRLWPCARWIAGGVAGCCYSERWAWPSCMPCWVVLIILRSMAGPCWCWSSRPLPSTLCRWPRSPGWCFRKFSRTDYADWPCPLLPFLCGSPLSCLRLRFPFLTIHWEPMARFGYTALFVYLGMFLSKGNYRKPRKRAWKK